MKSIITIVLSLALCAWLAACGSPTDDHADEHADGTHTHEDGSTHEDHDPGDEDTGHDDDADAGHDEEDHAHDETSLGTVAIGEFQVELAQGHGAVAAGQEGHLVVKLPYTDNGETIVRAWIGTEDRTLSFVGKGDYAPSHDDYDIHAVAPDPLPENTMWWIEVEKPDGTKIVGSAKPIME